MNSKSGLVGIIVIVGDEIVQGDIRDSNYRAAARRLDRKGVTVKGGLIVRDEEEEIVEAIERGIELGSDIIVVSGGLGSTHDDVTKKAVAEWADEPLSISGEASKQIRGLEGVIGGRSKEDRGKVRKMMKEMSKVPRGSIVVENPSGINPGFIFEKSASVIALPGVPSEFRSTLEVALERLGLSEVEIYTRSIEIDRSEAFYAGALLKTVRKFPDVGVGSYPKLNSTNMIRFRSLDKRSLREAVDFFLEQIKSGGKQD